MYCCDNAKTTAFKRYGTLVKRVQHRTYYIDGYGTCEAAGFCQEPDHSSVPASGTVRRYFYNGETLVKWYLCKEHLSWATAKTIAEAIADETTHRLIENTNAQ